MFDTLAVATSTGAVDMYHINGNHPVVVNKWRTIQVCDKSVLVLSLAWHPSPQKPNVLAVSLSDGNISLIDYGMKPGVRRTLQAHSLEAWTVSWSCNIDELGRHTLYSGGDDSGLGILTADQLGLDHTTDKTNHEASVFQVSLQLNTKIHGAGVTAILPIVSQHNLAQEMLLTGSYDEYIRVLRLDVSGRWNVLAEKHLGGGVWRLKILSKSSAVSDEAGTNVSYSILASCMHAGTRVLEIYNDHQDLWVIKVLSKFEEHESMNYGSDNSGSRLWEAPTNGGKEPVVIASTSFYDRKICVWTIPNR